ncbi:N-acetyltransferase [Lipingzhangella sp. LS1_29]|uniref:N-acetyltransferase n=1 Tax=Lipingzhangella rawalii TaxID=2055835 RepID=A0ABU2H2N7_9ACTN|nr:N-acetyltransferase [Lipingzhangella rawalii]
MITPGSERPHLLDDSRRFASGFPDFLQGDPYRDFLRKPDGSRDFAEYALTATLPDDDEHPVALAAMLPFRMRRREDGTCAPLPDDGWDGVVRWNTYDRLYGYTPDTLAALAVAIHPELRGHNLAATMVSAMRDRARELGFTSLVVPLRPPLKAQEPRIPMASYIARTRPDGLPADPWMRVHARLGGQTVGIAPAAMVVTARLDRWREWTELPFDTAGPVEVPGALSLVQVNPDEDYAVYVEPNVWIRHVLSTSEGNS